MMAICKIFLKGYQPMSSPDIFKGIPAAPGLQPEEIAIRLAGGVCEAYAAYNNGSNLTPKLPGYHSFNVINVYEIDPNGNPFSEAEAKAQVASRSTSSKVESVPSLGPAAYAARPGSVSPPCVGPTPVGTPSMGYQLFGFTATADDHSHNILVFRGTVTMEEAGYDLLGWGTNVPCLLPSQAWEWDQKQYGMVNSYLYAFYANTDYKTRVSLAASCMNAIQATMSHDPNIPWFVGGHSLGGAMVTLAVFDAVLSRAFGSQSPLVFTFGSLHVGDQSFATAYNSNVPHTYRIANLCDFVPSMVSLEPVTPSDPYVHVGLPGTFVWQTWDDWGNHSLATIYQPMVQSHWGTIRWGPRNYPQ